MEISHSQDGTIADALSSKPRDVFKARAWGEWEWGLLWTLSTHPSAWRRLLPLQASGQDVNLKKGVLPTDLFEDRDSESSSVVYAIVCTSMSLVGLKLKWFLMHRVHSRNQPEIFLASHPGPYNTRVEKRTKERLRNKTFPSFSQQAQTQYRIPVCGLIR